MGIYREPDGLAMSSRNSFITAEERPKASVLIQSLVSAKERIEAGERDFFAVENQAKAAIEAAGFTVDYFSVCNSKTLEPAGNDDQDITILGAMYTIGARLIDNLSFTLTPAIPRSSACLVA